MTITPERLDQIDRMEAAFGMSVAEKNELVRGYRASIELDADAKYTHRLAAMLECTLLDRPRSWDEACALLDEYRAACRAENPEPPTFMGEPVLPKDGAK